MTNLFPEHLDGRKIIQIAFHVDDLEQAALEWVRTFKAGPFFVYRDVVLQDVRDRDGNDGAFDLDVAFGQWGTVMVELVKIQRIEPSSVADIMMQPGLNHIATFIDDPEAERERLEQAGAPMLLALKFGDMPVHFHDARSTTGFVIEHYQCAGVIEPLYRKTAEAAVNWDGSDPVRGPVE